MDRDIYVPPSGPPTRMPDASLFSSMGEENIRRMMADFYERLALSEIAALFPVEKEARFLASQKSADFFISVMGGPDYFRERHGEPVMRRRHFRFPIDGRTRNAWLGCFFATLEKASEDYAFPPEHLQGFREYLAQFSAWMVNLSDQE